MRVLMLHNHYQQPGGEDECFTAEAALLEAHGHRVDRFVLHNDSIGGLGLAATAAKTVWNAEVYRELRRRIRQDRPDIVHAHNLFPLISPAAFHAAKAEGVAVVQSVHNFRLFCVNANFLRDGSICETCLGRAVPWPGVLHGCYRGSRALSAGVAAMTVTHRLLGTWRRRVDLFIALSGFVRSKLIAGGIPEAQIAVKPNFLLDDPGPGPQARGDYAVFAGRLSPEKGVGTLVAAWQKLPGAFRLKLVGDGPMAAELRAVAARDPRIEVVGRLPLPEVQELMRNATLVVAPSEVQETFGRVAIEAFAAGTPVIAARAGGLGELVEEGSTGHLFRPGDPADLLRCLGEVLADPPAQRRMGAAARARFEHRYTAAANYAAVMEIYEAAGARVLGATSPTAGALPARPAKFQA
jgi:glycosyltransferase involved in cell wall biosynthesis